jgi:15-cis-phytoene synthase
VNALENAPDVLLALAYAPARVREKLALLWELDVHLARVLQIANDPMIAQIRLAWWRDNLIALDTNPPPAEPLLQRLVEKMVVNDVSGTALAAIVDGWESLVLADMLSDTDFEHYASARGGTIFRLACILAGADASWEAEQAGAAWALTDFSRHCSDPALAARAVNMARARLGQGRVSALRSVSKALAILTAFTEDDIKGGIAKRHRAGSPQRIIRILIFLLLRR